MDKMKSRYLRILPVLGYFYRIVWQVDKKYIISLLLSMVVKGVMPFANIVLPKVIIDELMNHRRVDEIVKTVALLVSLNLCAYLLNNLFTYFMDNAQRAIDTELEGRLAEKNASIDYEFTESATVLAQMTGAREGLENYYSEGVTGLSRSTSAIVSGIITIFGTIYIISRLSAWMVAALITLIVISMVFVSKTQAAEAALRKSIVYYNRRVRYFYWIAKEFDFGKDVRLYGADDLLYTHNMECMDEQLADMEAYVKINNGCELGSSLASAAQQAALYAYLGISVIRKAITIGEFQMMVGAAVGFSTALSNAVREFIILAKNAGLLNQYIEYMNEPYKAPSGGKSIDDMGQRLSVEFQDVSFRYPGTETEVLKNVSITILPGQKLSIVGENGAGKTTFIKLLARLYDPTQGRILVNGRDIRDYDKEEYFKLFSVVFQDFALFGLTVGENIGAGENPDAARLESALRKAGVYEKIWTLPKRDGSTVHKNFDREGVEFSGGESQRLAIARAIYKDAPAMILDEPTAALDPVAEYEIYNHFNDMIGNKTTIYISHRLSSCRFSDVIAVFEDGAITEYGDHETLAASGGKYSEMWNAQAKYYI